MLEGNCCKEILEIRIVAVVFWLWKNFLFSVKICEVCILNDIKGDTTLQRQKCAVYGGEKNIWKKRKIRLKMM